MKLVDIRFLKEWESGDKTYPKGYVGRVSEEDSKSLVDNGIVELYEPKAGDVHIYEPQLPDSGFKKEELEDIINDILKKSSQFQQNQNGEDDFVKTGGFSSFGEFASDVYKSTAKRQTSEKLKTYMEKAPTGHGEAVNADGGFLVPTEYRNTLMSNVLERSQILNRCQQIPMATNSLEIPIIEESTRASSVYGGIIVYRPAEGGSITASTAKFGKVELKLSKLAALTYVTSELLEDSPISLEPLIGMKFGEALGFQIDEDIVNGTGVGQALGIMNAPCLISVTKESGQAADTIKTENILKMYSRMLTSSRRNCVWLANNDTLPQLQTMTLNVGTGGAPIMLVRATDSLAESIFARPLIYTEHCQTVGTSGDIICADLSQYLVGQKAGGGVKAATSIHLKFDQDEVAFRFIVRIDGQPWMTSALTPKHSSNTLSSFVALNSRD